MASDLVPMSDVSPTYAAKLRDAGVDLPALREEVAKRPSAVAGRKKCTACGKLPGNMTEHWKKERDTHGPMSTENPEALRNLPGLDQLSKHVGSIFSDRRM